MKGRVSKKIRKEAMEIGNGRKKGYVINKKTGEIKLSPVCTRAVKQELKKRRWEK